MFWGGGFAMKNAVQQSTKDAIDKVLTRLIADLRMTYSEMLTIPHGLNRA